MLFSIRTYFTKTDLSLLTRQCAEKNFCEKNSIQEHKKTCIASLRIELAGNASSNADGVETYLKNLNSLFALYDGIISKYGLVKVCVIIIDFFIHTM